jgi:hypothetical protein
MEKFKYETLLLTQLLLAVISPVVDKLVDFRFILDIALSLVLAAAIYVISNTKKHFIIGMTLMLPSILLLWTGKILHSEIIEMIAYTISLTFFCYVVYQIMKDIFSTRLVTFDIIAGGISVYFFIGNIWGILYAIIARFDAGAFNIPEITQVYLGDSIGEVGTAMYFSFVTLTTLGYGDITPISPIARSLAYLEAAIGQIYLTVLIASLVGMHISKKTEGTSK